MENNETYLTLREWAYRCMPLQKAKCFIEYFDGRLYRIDNHKPVLLKETDKISEEFFKCYSDDYERFLKLNH